MREFSVRLHNKISRGLELAAFFVEGEVVRSISIGQPIRRGKGGSVTGLNPSKPGEPPHVLLGRLRQSITHLVTGMKAYVGTNVVYSRRLEKGFVGTDSLGRNINQLPRPYLTTAVRHNAGRILELLNKG
jgi:phage gpG-like protein